jgi:hypothetical protein
MENMVTDEELTEELRKVSATLSGLLVAWWKVILDGM